jgi:hypothetical protein
MTLVAKSCDPADQAAIRDWGEDCLSPTDDSRLVQLYGAGTSIYLEAGAAAGAADGGIAHPYAGIGPAGNRTAGAKIWIKGGTYASSAGIYSTAGTWRAHNGVARLQ